MFSEPLLHVVQVGAALVDRARAVKTDEVGCSGSHHHLGAGNASGADAGNHDLEILDFLMHQLHGVGQGRQHNHGCPMLIVVEDRNVQLFL